MWSDSGPNFSWSEIWPIANAWDFFNMNKYTTHHKGTIGIEMQFKKKKIFEISISYWRQTFSSEWKSRDECDSYNEFYDTKEGCSRELGEESVRDETSK